MTALTHESLEAVLLDMAHMVTSRGEVIRIRPKHLIIPPVMYRSLMYRTPIRKARGIRGRKKALYGRSKPLIWKVK